MITCFFEFPRSSTGRFSIIQLIVVVLLPAHNHMAHVKLSLWVADPHCGAFGFKVVIKESDFKKNHLFSLMIIVLLDW